MPEVIAYYDPGADITCHASVALTGGRAVAITADRRAGGPAGIDDTSDGLIVVGLTTDSGRVFGVASHDAALNSKVNIMRPPKVVPLEKGIAPTIAAFAEISIDATGRAKALVATAPVGFILTGQAGGIGTFVQAQLYSSGTVST